MLATTYPSSPYAWSCADQEGFLDAWLLSICGTFLDINGVKTLRVLKKAGLRHETDADLHSDDAFVFMFFALFRFLTWRVRHSQPLFATRICVLFFVIS
jgi:hypothetical protein